MLKLSCIYNTFLDQNSTNVIKDYAEMLLQLIKSLEKFNCLNNSQTFSRLYKLKKILSTKKKISQLLC